MEPMICIVLFLPNFHSISICYDSGSEHLMACAPMLQCFKHLISRWLHFCGDTYKQFYKVSTNKISYMKFEQIFQCNIINILMRWIWSKLVVEDLEFHNFDFTSIENLLFQFCRELANRKLGHGATVLISPDTDPLHFADHHHTWYVSNNVSWLPWLLLWIIPRTELQCCLWFWQK